MGGRDHKYSFSCTQWEHLGLLAFGIVRISVITVVKINYTHGYSGKHFILLAQWKYEGFLVWVHHIRQKSEILLLSLRNNGIYLSSDTQDFCDQGCMYIPK